MAAVSRILDVRLNNVSQLAGFSKRDDLRFFLREICHAGYVHIPDLAPTQPMLDEYKKQSHDWDLYEKKYIELLNMRNVAAKLERDIFDRACLLCSEDTPDRCHRRLAIEYLRDRWGEIDIVHL